MSTLRTIVPMDGAAARTPSGRKGWTTAPAARAARARTAAQAPAAGASARPASPAADGAPPPARQSRSTSRVTVRVRCMRGSMRKNASPEKRRSWSAFTTWGAVYGA